MKTLFSIAVGITLVFSMIGPAVSSDYVRYRTDRINGTLIDGETKKPVQGAVINASWIMHPTKSGPITHGHRLFIQQVVSDSKGRFTITGWTGTKIPPKGWSLSPGKDPMISVFHENYSHLSLPNAELRKSKKNVIGKKGKTKTLRSVWNKKTILLRPMIIKPKKMNSSQEYQHVNPFTKMDLIQVTKEFIDQEISAYRWIGDETKAIRSQLLLADKLEVLCAGLRRLASKEHCIDPESTISKLLVEHREVIRVLTATKPAKKRKPKSKDKIIGGGVALK